MTDRVDTFNRADNTTSLGVPSDAGSAWVVNNGVVFGISSNAAYLAASSSQATAYLETGVNNVDVQVTLTKAGVDAGILVRGTNNWNYLVVTAGSSSGYHVYKRVNSTFIQIASYGPNAADNDVVRFRATSSNVLTLFVNGVTSATGVTTDSFNSSATQHGLRANSDIVSRFDNFSVSSLSALTPIGGGLDTLHALTEGSAGNIGANAGVVDVLRHITVSSVGVVSTSARIGGGLDTFSPLSAAAGGSVVASTVVSGAGQDTLQPVTISLSGLAGALAGVADTFNPLNTGAGGNISLVGNALIGGAGDAVHALSTRSLGGKVTYALVPAGANDRLHALQSFSGGFIPTADQIPVQGGAPAWWGYEGQPGGRGRPWWYSDLKDKAAALDRLRKARIELGILPAPQNKKIKKVIKETKEFIEEKPTPSTADYYMAREEVIRDKVEAELARLDEEDDERAIMDASKFFFPRKLQQETRWNH